MREPTYFCLCTRQRTRFFWLIAKGNGRTRLVFRKNCRKKNFSKKRACQFPLAINGKNTLIDGREGKSGQVLSFNILFIAVEISCNF